MKTYDISKFTIDDSLPIAVGFMPPGMAVADDYHDHNFSEIVLVTEGRAIHRIGGGRREIERGDVLLIAPNCVHGYHDAKTLGLVNVIYDPRMHVPGIETCNLPLMTRLFPKEYPSPDTMLEPVFRFKDDMDITTIYSLTERLDYEARHMIPGRSIQLVSIFLEIIVYLARYAAPESVVEIPPPDGIKAVARFINLNYAKPLTAADLSAVAKMSDRSLFRHFRETYACSPMEYLRRVRVQRANEMLLTTRKSIGEIAFECGFCDGNHFSKTFSKIMRMSPAKARKAARTRSVQPNSRGRGRVAVHH